MSISKSNTAIILYYDGSCNLCNRVVRWIKTHPKGRGIECEPLNEKEFQILYQELTKPAGQTIDSVVLKKKDKLFVESEAILILLRYLGGIYWLLYPLNWIPKGLSDSLYRYVARHRYRWFGKRNHC